MSVKMNRRRMLQLGGAGLDVLEDERSTYHDFSDLNVVITPHLGWYTTEAVDRVLSENLHGLEIDQRCVELAAFAIDGGTPPPASPMKPGLSRMLSGHLWASYGVDETATENPLRPARGTRIKCPIKCLTGRSCRQASRM